jgi:hypothetical protein
MLYYRKATLYQFNPAADAWPANRVVFTLCRSIQKLVDAPQISWPMG